MKNSKTFVRLICAMTALTSAASYATTLPESYNLQTTNADANESDPGLVKWFADHSDAKPPFDRPAAAFEKFAQSFDALTAAFLRLRYANLTNKDEEQQIKNAIDEYTKYEAALAAKQQTKHPFAAYLLDEILQSTKVNLEASQFALPRLGGLADRSCPEKDLVLKEINEEFGKANDGDKLNQMIERIFTFNARRFQEEALDAFLDALPSDKRDAIKSGLVDRIKAFPKLLEDNTWLLDEGSDRPSSSDRPDSEPFKSYRQASDQAQRKHCRTAKDAYVEALKKSDSDNNGHFDEAKAVANEIETCFRRKGSTARKRFWQQIDAPLKAAFDFRGEEIAKVKLGHLYWSDDNFDKARATFNYILVEATNNKLEASMAYALMTLARIEENNGNLESALQYFEQFIKRSSEGENYMNALMSAVLINSMIGKVDAALVNADKLIEAQVKLPIDQRSSANLSFGLFWAGRLHYTQGNKAIAMEMWRRVASEYYSTFYGALGHYLLEKNEGRHLELQPSRTPAFNIPNLFKAFKAEDQLVISRIERLLELGLKQEATCEIAELKVEDGNQDMILVKSLFQNAVGDWLASIKNYDSLNRSYRHSLPVGFEKLLYPRAYEDAVGDYSRRLNIDPNFVFAIIRQESVFNPKARSSAGASGLMQLMPQTAKVEVRRLDQRYLPQARRREIEASTIKRGALLNADTNLAIGVHHVHRLLKKYGNPVLVLAAYNANPRAAARWLEKFPMNDFLAFIERIPYSETRQYIKLVMRNYFYYKRWYEGPSGAMGQFDDLALNSMGLAKTVITQGGN